MDYQSIQPMEQQDSSMKLWYIVVALVVIALAAWYFYGSKAPADTGATATEQSQTLPLTAGNTTADISADLAQTPDTTAALDADAASAAQAVSGF